MNSERVKAEILAAKKTLLKLPVEELRRQLVEHENGTVARMLIETGALGRKQT